MNATALTLDEIRSATAPVGKSTGLVLSDVLLILGAVLAISLGLFVWARYIRKPRQERSRPYEIPTPQTVPQDDSDEGGSTRSHSRHRRHRRRHRRRDHRKRNPTLAEAGGLPPARDAVPPESP
jgi:hypothetical protein